MKNQFELRIEQALQGFLSLDKKEPIRIISHLDADGICACSILISALNKENRKYSLSIVPHLNEDVLIELSGEEYRYYFFTDLGSGQLSLIRKYLPGKKIFVLDHHKPEHSDDGIFHVNPHLNGSHNDKSISGAGVVYMFVKKLNNENRNLAHLAIIGAIGDVQEQRGFKGYNEEILQDAIASGNLMIKHGLRLFGMQSKPLHKVLEYSTDPLIPGVYGSETNVIAFLNSLAIDIRKGVGWKKINDLTEDERKKLIAGIVSKLKESNVDEDVIGPVYLLQKEKAGPLRDAKEFSTLLNACGRMNQASIGIGACLGNKDMKIKAIQMLQQYRKEIIKSLKWYENSKDSNNVIIENGFIIINAEEHITPTLAGTIASIIANSNNVKHGTYVLSMSQMDNGKTKASLRVSGNGDSDTDLRKVLKNIVAEVKGVAGGHKLAAGALFRTDYEDKFIFAAKRILKNFSMEEVVA